MSESYIEFNYRMATLLTSLGWRVTPAYDASNPLWADKPDKKPILGGRNQGEDGFPGTKPRTQAFVDKHWKPGSGKHQGALVGLVMPFTISHDGDRHPNAEGIIEHDGVAALQRIIDKYGVDISGAIRGTTPGKGTPETQGARLIFQRSAEAGNQLDTSKMDRGNRPGKLPKGIDVQAGDGAHVIGPCRRYDGREWTWDRFVGPRELARLPSIFNDIRSGSIKLDGEEVGSTNPLLPKAMPRSNASVTPPTPKVSLPRTTADAPAAAALTSTPSLPGSASSDWLTTVGDMKAAQIGFDRELNGDPVTGAIGLAQEPEGGRGKRSNAVSFRAGRLLERGLLPDEGEAVNRIYAANVTNGLVAKDGAQTVADNIRRAIADGREREREEREAEELRAFMAEARRASLTMSAAYAPHSLTPETQAWLAIGDRAIGNLREGSTAAEYWSVVRRLSEGVRVGALDAETVVRLMMVRALTYGVPGVSDIVRLERGLERNIAAYVSERTPEGLIQISAESDWRVAQSWLFKDMIPSIGVGLIYGVSGIGKTFVLLDAMRAVATGEAFAGIEPSLRGGGILLAGEDIEGMRKRIAALHIDIATGKKVHHDLPIAALEAKQLADPIQRMRTKASLWRLVDAMDRKGMPLRVLGIDTAKATGLVTKENDNDEMQRAVDIAQEFASEFGAAVPITHHPTKSNEEVERGGGAFRGGMDFVIRLAHMQGLPTIHVGLNKSRHAETRKLGTCRRAKVRLGINDAGEEVTTVRIEWTTEGDAAPRDYHLLKLAADELTRVNGPMLARKALRDEFKRKLAHYATQHPHEDISVDPHRMNDSYRRCENYLCALRLAHVNEEIITFLFGTINVPAKPDDSASIMPH